MIPVGGLKIGATEFQKADEKNPKPVDVSWTVGPSHRIVFSAFPMNPQRGQFWITPTVVANWTNLSVTGTGDKDGKPTVATEGCTQFHFGVGGEAVYNYRYSRLRCLGVASGGYGYFDTEWSWWVDNGVSFGVGYSASSLKFPQDTTVRSQGIYGTVGMRF